MPKEEQKPVDLEGPYGTSALPRIVPAPINDQHLDLEGGWNYYMDERRKKLFRSLADAALDRLVPSHPNEAQFQQWYTAMARDHALNPNADDPSQYYDYRSAMMAGATPDATGHWPSQFKRAGHPNEVVGGFNTRTGERVPGAPLARSVDELVALGWEPATAQELWKRR